MLETNYQNLSKDDLVKIAEYQHQELIIQEGVIKRYANHLERVIEHNAVENYRKTVQKNREVASTPLEEKVNLCDKVLSNSNTHQT